MKFKIESEVYFEGLTMHDEYIHEFDDKSNVFGRVLEYHQRMYKTFPGLEFKLIKAVEL